MVVLGNHDAAMIAGCDSMNGAARASIEWTRRRLDKNQQDFLAGLPLTAESGDVLFVHADAAQPRALVYVTSSVEAQRSMRATPKRADHLRPRPPPAALRRPRTFGLPNAKTPTAGVPISLAGSGKWLAVLGSVGQPRDDNPAAAYAIYDDAAGRLTFLRVAYDIATAARKIRAAGLPEILAARLFVGR